MSTTDATIHAHLAAKEVCQKIREAIGITNFYFAKCRGCGILYRDAQIMNGKRGQLDQSPRCRKGYGKGGATNANSCIYT
jgi:hypothetical protein